MNSRATDRFWKCYSGLPEEIRRQAREAYALFLKDPYHPGLHFKRVHSTRPVFSVRISKDYRAVGILRDDEITWFWIGSHSEYDNVLRQLRNA